MRRHSSSFSFRMFLFYVDNVAVCAVAGSVVVIIVVPGVGCAGVFICVDNALRRFHKKCAKASEPHTKHLKVHLRLKQIKSTCLVLK